MAKELKELTPRSENYAQWYNDLVIKANLAENSAVRGCMVIKPYGYAIWEKMQQQLDRMFKETGHVNAYFPLFIPKSFMSREAEHVEGFAKECAVVTHYRLKNDPDGNGLVVDPEAKLEEELIVRPTSETIIWNTYKNWIHSYRDLPLLINQWANVVRWEMRTRLFLRTTEFLWQEGHTAHATREEAEAEAKKMLEVYTEFAEKYMAMPVIKGVKSASERFAGAEETYTIEAMMQDGKALQAGTSHFLGQNFAKAFDVQFTDQNGNRDYVWATSWGVSTRLAMGGRDLENNTIEVARRDTLTKETVPCEGIADYVKNLLGEIQQNIYQKAFDFRASQIREVNSYDEFKEEIEKGGFLLCHWDGTPKTEELVKNETKATIRCIPLEGDKTPGKCMVTGKPSTQRVIFARAY
jgi:prolyl-tRNA synthetase